MGMVRFERTAAACDVVADQFKLGAFGGVVFKAMAVGAPICTYLDEPQLLRCFSEVPPVINCRATDDVTRQLGAALRDPAALATLATQSRRWMARHHASADTVATQVERYRDALDIAAGA